VSATNELRVQPKTEAQGFEAKQVPKLGINKVSGNVVFADPIGRAQLKMLQRQSRNYCVVKELLCWRGVRSLASFLVVVLHLKSKPFVACGGVWVPFRRLMPCR